jgi:hypothetical protein
MLWKVRSHGLDNLRQGRSSQLKPHEPPCLMIQQPSQALRRHRQSQACHKYPIEVITEQTYDVLAWVDPLYWVNLVVQVTVVLVEHHAWVMPGLIAFNDLGTSQLAQNRRQESRRYITECLEAFAQSVPTCIAFHVPGVPVWISFVRMFLNLK